MERFISIVGLICTVALAVVGIIGIRVALNTLKAINRQARILLRQTSAARIAAEAAKDSVKIIERQTTIMATQTEILKKSLDLAKVSADAALLNAQAVINSERPWIVVSIHPHPNIAGTFVFKATNRGRTPAELVSGHTAHTFTTIPDNLPVPPNYVGPIICPNETLLVPEGSFDINVPPGVRPQAILDNRQLADQMFNSNDVLIFYGRIVYRDVLTTDGQTDTSHETCWCYACLENGNRFIATGPKEYNSRT